MTALALNLPEQIEAEHQAAIGAARSADELTRAALTHAARCGEMLIKAQAECEGELELNYAPEGLICEVVFPLE